MDEHEQNLEKYRELYDHSRDLHFAQIDRFNRIDQKAAMFLSAITVLLGFASFFLKNTLGDAVPPENCGEWFLIILAMLSGIAILLSWFAFLSVLRIRELENLRLDQATLDFVRNNRRIDIHYAISRRAAEAFAANDIQIAAKVRRLTTGYFFALLSMGFLTIGLAVFGFTKWTETESRPNVQSCKVSIDNEIYKEKGEMIMTEETSGNNNEQQSGDGNEGGSQPTSLDQPNTDVEAPTNIIQTNAVDYLKVTQRDAGRSIAKKD